MVECFRKYDFRVYFREYKLLKGTTESNTPLQDLNTKYNLGIDTKGLGFLYLVATPKTNVMNNIIGNGNSMKGSNLSSVIGSLNNIMNSDLSDVHGVNNHLTADKENGSSYAMLSGYGNKGKIFNIQLSLEVKIQSKMEVLMS